MLKLLSPSQPDIVGGEVPGISSTGTPWISGSDQLLALGPRASSCSGYGKSDEWLTPNMEEDRRKKKNYVILP